ncbi:MAG: C1 family peptidase [Bacteroidales bacterium]|nr:C1 family peptidase [Bacteroidales bacterium]
MFIFLIRIPLFAQNGDNEGYVFTTVKEVKATPVKNQYRSGTCWSYSALSFLESELLRKGKSEYDLSEMWIVRHTYPAKAEKYMRLHGNISLSAGGSFGDVLWVMRNYGIVPQNSYQGLNYGEDKDVHSELDAATKAYADAILKTSERSGLTTAWMDGFEGIMDAYLGERPEKFSYNGKEYTPQSFMQSLGLNLDDYVSITSYTHHPFYEPFILEIPDNWIWGSSYNVPMNEMQEIVNNAINIGYSVLWGADVSENGFAYRKGVAVVPVTKTDEMSDSDKARWIGVSDKDRESQIMNLDKPVTERKITQDMRQIAFDNFQTTDDHGMHITGIAKDQNSKIFYKVKNSWGTNDSKYDGYFYCSEAFFLYKTMNIMVHKSAIPKDTANKLGLK